MMKTAVAIKHIAFEDLGSWEKRLAKEYQVQYIDAIDSNLPLLKNENIDLLIVLGGPIGVYQEDEYPLIKPELSLLENRLKQDLPTLGICLGSQLMARALGAKVYPNHTKEIGWSPLTLTEKGKTSAVQYLESQHTSMFHWHGDTFDLPEGAELLASTLHCQNQIFAWGKNGLAFQCHPEIISHSFEYWLIGHASELSHHKLSVNDLRKESAKFAPQLEKQSLQFLETWLHQINHC
jgi:GMP synthase (glutamine-hydrolysing)